MLIYSDYGLFLWVDGKLLLDVGEKHFVRDVGYCCAENTSTVGNHSIVDFALTRHETC
jgi:hypothetical protein